MGKKRKVEATATATSELDANAYTNENEAKSENPKQRKKIAQSGDSSQPTGLEIYWKLSSVNRGEREAAALALAKEIQAAQQEFEKRGRKVEEGVESILLSEQSNELLKSCCPDLRYALPRLVRGVASSNLCARQGFALALTTISALEPCVSIDLLLSLIEKEIEASSSMKAQEFKDGLFGKLFAYAAIIRAERLIGDASSKKQQASVRKIVEELVKLARKKTFLRCAATSTLLELMQQLPVQALEQCIVTVDAFQEFLQASPEVGGADVLLMALQLLLKCPEKKLPQEIRAACPLLPKSGSLQDLFQPSHMEVLIPYLKESSITHPKVHPVWELLADVLSNDQLFSGKKGKQKSKTHIKNGLITFWSSVVDETLLVSSHERKHLAMQLTLLFVSKLPISFIPIIISNAFGRCLLDILSSEKNLLYSSAKQFLSDLCRWAAKDQDRLVPVVASLQQSSCGKFDHLSKTNTVRELIAEVKDPRSCLFSVQNVRDMFLNDPSSSSDDSDEAKKASDRRKIWILDLLSGLCKLRAASKLACKEVLVFLAAHVLTSAGLLDDQKLADLLGWSPVATSKPVQEACSVKLRVLLTDKSLLRVRSKSGAEADQIEDMGTYLVEFFRPAFKSFDGENNSAMLRETILQLSSAVQKELEPNKDTISVLKLKAMRCLLSQLVIESWLHPGQMDDVVVELLICCKKAFGKLVKVPLEAVDTKNDPPVVDVLVDVVLSLLSNSSAPVRNAADQLFSVFCSDVTASSMDSMLKVVTKHTAPRVNNLFRLEDKDDDDDDDIVVVEDHDDEKAAASSDDESCLESLEGDEDVGERDENEVQAAMDDAELSDMDDEAMFRIDNHLAQILKQRKKGGGEDPSAQLEQFKSRVLGLLDSFCSNQPANPLLLVALPTIFQVHLDASVAGKGSVASKSLSILNKAFNAKQHPKGSSSDVAVVKDLLDKLLKVLSGKDNRFRTTAEAFAIWLMKVGLAIPDGAACKGIGEFMLKVIDAVFQRSSRLGPGFVKNSIGRFPSSGLGKYLIGNVLDKCRNSPTDRLNAEAMVILGIILKPYATSKAAPPDAEAFAWALKPYLPVLSEALVRYLSLPQSKAWSEHKAYVRLPMEWLEALQVLFPGRSLSKLIDMEAVFKALATFKSLAKGKLKTTAEKLESLLQAAAAQSARNTPELKTKKLLNEAELSNTKKKVEAEMDEKQDASFGSKEEQTRNKQRADIENKGHKQEDKQQERSAKRKDAGNNDQDAKSPSKKKKKEKQKLSEE